jgi:hypothetical protein
MAHRKDEPVAQSNSIRVVNLLIRDAVVHLVDDDSLSPARNLVQKRFREKFEEPRGDIASQRRSDAWDRWISFDEGLQPKGILGPHWAEARLWLHQLLSDYRMGELMFTNGSSFEPLGVHTSIACKLSGVWTITADCFDLFAKYAYWHRALKHAVKKRFRRYCITQVRSERVLNRILWNKFKKCDEFAFEIFKFKLLCTVKFVRGNRWSTVPKNNLKDRAICLEPLCNMLVQRAVGLGLRSCLKDKTGVDLNVLADEHRRRISDFNIATIDLSDCSDAISMRLIKYLLPKRIFNQISTCRSDMTLGPDDNYYIVNKVSSMGNGFTFDLMTLILTALTRSFDPTSTVFGDDIICQNSCAVDVCESLRLAGFVVNLNKTNINSSYRESCGAHFIDGHGYVTSFDIKWVKTMHELIVTLNKVAILSYIYGEPYETLRAKIWTCVPPTLLGATVSRLTVNTGRPPSYELDTFVRYGPTKFVRPTLAKARFIRRIQKDYQKPGRVSVALAYRDLSLRAANTLSAYEWDMFYQHIHNVRLSRRIPRLVNKSSLVARIDEEQIGFIGSFVRKD